MKERSKEILSAFVSDNCVLDEIPLVPIEGETVEKKEEPPLSVLLREKRMKLEDVCEREKRLKAKRDNLKQEMMKQKKEERDKQLEQFMEYKKERNSNDVFREFMEIDKRAQEKAKAQREEAD